jgi:type IV pilus assembly protein PilC
MPYFLCRLASEDGRVFDQTLLASTREECQKFFESEGLFVLSIKKDWKKIQIRVLPFEKRIKDRDFIMFNQELVALLKSGYPVLKGIEILSGRVKNVYFKEILIKVENSIRQGKSLSEAFLPFENKFSKVYTASLLAGERSGNLPGAVGRYIDYAKVISQTKSRIRSALIYPTLLLVFALIMMGVLINFILPKFYDFYVNFEAQLPWISRFVMSLSLMVRRYTPFVLVILIGLALAYLRMKRQEKNVILLDKLKLKIPYGRTIWVESGISLFSRTLGLLLEAGIPLLASSGLSRFAVPNKYLVHKMDKLSDYIKNGESLSESLAKAQFFPPLALDMIRIGETSANLEGMLADVANFYDEKVRIKIDTFVSLIEPVVIILMGLLVAGMLLSVYLPIFNIIRVAR